MNDELRDAAAKAVVYMVIERHAKKLKDEAKAQLAALESGDTVAGKVNGQVVGKATMTKGRQKIVITDESQLLAFMRTNHPTEIVQTVNKAYLTALEEKAKQVGAVIDHMGELVPGVELEHSESYVSVRSEKVAEEIIRGLLMHGLVELDGIRATPELESA